jgi:hypothetical protein
MCEDWEECIRLLYEGRSVCGFKGTNNRTSQKKTVLFIAGGEKNPH